MQSPQRQSGVSRFSKPRRRSALRYPLRTRASIASHGSVAVRSLGPSSPSTSTPASAIAWFHASRRSHSPQPSNIAPRSRARAITAPRRRSPRESSASSADSSGSFQVSFDHRMRLKRARSSSIRRFISGTGTNGSHWNGVHALGTNGPTDTFTSALRLPTLRAASRIPSARRASSSRSSSVSVGRPIIAYTLIRFHPRA